MIRKINSNKNGIIEYAIDNIEDLDKLPRKETDNTVYAILNKNGKRLVYLYSKAEKDYILINGDLEEINKEIKDINEQLETKAKQVELDTLKTRMDSFTSLAEGSTTGDAELIDARIDAEGFRHINVGSNIRSLNSDFLSIVDKSKNMWDKNNVEVGKFISNTNRAIQTNETYCLSDFIPVIPNSKIWFKYGARFVATYTNHDTWVASQFSSIKNGGSIIIPENIYFIRITCTLSSKDIQMINAGDELLPYSEYGSKTIKEEVLPNQGVKSVNGKTGEVVLTYSDIKVDYKNNYLSGVSNKLYTGQKIQLENNSIKTNKHLIFTTDVEAMGEILICHGKTEYNSNYIKIDKTNLYVYEYPSSKLKETIPHGLTIKNNLQVRIDVDSSCNAKIIICSNGIKFEKTVAVWYGCNGAISVEIISGSYPDAKLSWTCDGYTKPIHLYGDSYFGNLYANRWVTHLVKDGYSDNCLIDGFGGKTTQQAYDSFILNLEKSNPKFAVWCMGVNDPDTDSEINSSWKTYTDNFIQKCKDNNIIPILATIPNVKGGAVDDTNISTARNHNFKNQYIKNSGFRYIDFAKAVGAYISNEWYEGMLSSDGVHPETSGAIALYHQALCDFPEIMIG